MFRVLVAALYLISIPGPAAWAEAAEEVVAPAPVSPQIGVVPVATQPLNEEESSAVAPLAEPVESLVRSPTTESNSVRVSVPVIKKLPHAGEGVAAVAENATRVGASESDVERVNFADGLRRRAQGAFSVLAGPPRRWLSSLSRSGLSKPSLSPSPVHGYGGRLIVGEGLDGGGKSTQEETVAKALRSRGFEVVVTGNNSSERVGPIIRQAKKDRTLTPERFAELEQQDFYDRKENIVIPALKRGAVVIADRWFYTMLARDSVRGVDPQTLQRLYASELGPDALRPDLTFLFKVPVQTATDRVLKRTEGRLGLSENFEEGAARRVLGMNYYAAWADKNFSSDPRKNYDEAQRRVAESYDEQAAKFGFHVIDASRSREEIAADVMPEVFGALGLRETSYAGAATQEIPSPAPDVSNAKKKNPFNWGVFSAQFGNFGIQAVLAGVILPLAAHSALWVFYAVFATAVADSVGSFIAGWFAEKNPMKAVRSLTVARALVLLSIPLLAATGALSLPLAFGVFMIDALLRGVIDAASISYLAKVGGNSLERQKAVNAAYSSKFELGAIVGPAVIAGVLTVAAWLGAPAIGLIVGGTLISAAFLAAAFLFKRVPVLTNAVPSDSTNPVRAARTVFSNPLLKSGFWALMALALYPLRNALPQMFGTMLFHNSASIGWLVAVFGLGGLIGSWLFRSARLRNVSLRSWGVIGAAGTVVLAMAWVFPVYAWVVPAILLFSITNMIARNSVQSEFMARLPPGQAGALSAFSRSGVKVMALVVKFLPTLAVVAPTQAAKWLPSLSNTLASVPNLAFILLGCALGAFALAQFFATKNMANFALAGGLFLLGPRLPVKGDVPHADAPAAFHRDPAADRAKYSDGFMKDILDPKKGEAFFYRQSRVATNERFQQMPVSEEMPEAALNGNLIVENVKRTANATWAEDFDNAGPGKYGLDIARFLISLSYYQRGPADGFLNAEAAESFKNGYLSGLRNPEKGFPAQGVLAKGEKIPSTNEYFAANRKKIREMRKNPLAVDDKGMLRLLRKYLKSIGGERLLLNYQVELAGKTTGTTERWDATLVLLKPKEAHSHKDRILFVVKTPTQPEPSKAGHFGRGVVESAELFAPGTLLRPESFTSKGKEYYGYQVSTLNGKIKKRMSADELAALAYSIGAQQGRGVRLKLDDKGARVLENHVRSHFADIVAAAGSMKREISAAYSAYAAEAARAKVVAPAAPATGDDDDDAE